MKKIIITTAATISAGLLLVGCAAEDNTTGVRDTPEPGFIVEEAELIDGPRIDIAANSFHMINSDTNMTIELAGSGDCVPTITDVTEADDTVTVTYTKEGKCMLRDFRMYAYTIDSNMPLFEDNAIVNVHNLTDDIEEQSIKL